MNRLGHNSTGWWCDETIPEKWREPPRPDHWRKPPRPKNWREVGELIRRKLRDPSQRLVTGTLWERFIRPGRTNFDLALRSAVDGDLGPLIDYLGSGGEAAEHSVTDFAAVAAIFGNMVLAAALKQYLLRSETKMQNENPPPPKHKPGPSPDVGARVAAETARQFFEKWKQWNRDFGISNRGICGKMRERALEIVIEDYFPGQAADKEKLLTLMGRPKHRRALPRAK